MGKSATDPRIGVLVTAIGGIGYGDQILKALRLVPAGRYRIVGADVRSECPQFAKVDAAVTLPRADSPEYVDAVIAVCRDFDLRAAFIGCEPELKVVAQHRERFAAAGIFLPVNRPQMIAQCFDKAACMKAIEDAGFPTPRQVAVDDPSDLDAIDWFPVVVKPARQSGGSVDCFIAQDPGELYSLASYLHLGSAGRSFMVQEYVGTPSDEYSVGILYDMNGQYLNSIAVRRDLGSLLNVKQKVPNRTGRTDLGPLLAISSGVSHGEIGPYPEVATQCRAIADIFHPQGPINIQCRLVNGRVRVFEINPRFSGTTSLRAMVGYNEPDLLIRKHLCNEPIAEGFPFRSATILRSLTETELVPNRVQAWNAPHR
ncbi:MAG: ATP-grasp domain-containing protein [Gammaproteobacteria bacterium]|nr:ATP-grasp domain-containing protein [Gammaproteobacteria bacterium]